MDGRLERRPAELERGNRAAFLRRPPRISFTEPLLECSIPFGRNETDRCFGPKTAGNINKERIIIYFVFFFFFLVMSPIELVF